MNRFLSSIALTVVFVTLLIMIRAIKSELAIPLSLCISVMLTGISLAICNPIIDFLNNLVEPSSKNYITLLLKSVGISLVVSTASDICRDCGENAIAAKVELLGKCEILLLSLPLLKEITALITDVLQT
ncbi:MAG: hypothetical protein IJD35_06965 [Clostridia bacterium]|nr:hypothetical protein [Clostridia bacterium]